MKERLASSLIRKACLYRRPFCPNQASGKEWFANFLLDLGAYSPLSKSVDPGGLRRVKSFLRSLIEPDLWRDVG